MSNNTSWLDEVDASFLDEVDASFDKPAAPAASSSPSEAYARIVAQRQQRLGAKTQQEPDEPGAFDALMGGAKRTGLGLATMADVVTGDDAGVYESTKAAEAIPNTPDQQAFMLDLKRRMETEGDVSVWQAVKNVAGATWANPTGAYHEMVAQLPNSGVVLGGMYAGAKTGASMGRLFLPNPGAGMVVGGLVGGIVGMFVGNTAIEGGFIAQEQAREGEYDREDVLAKSAIKGGFITGVDVFTMGANRALFGAGFRATEKALAGGVVKGKAGQAVAGKVKEVMMRHGVNPADQAAAIAAMSTNRQMMKEIRKEGAAAFWKALPKKQRAALAATGVTLESFGEGLGEYGGSTLAGLDASLTEAVLEATMSLPQSAAETAIGAGLAKYRGQPGAVAPPLSGAHPGVQGDAPPESAGATQPPPPGPAGAPAAGMPPSGQTVPPAPEPQQTLDAQIQAVIDGRKPAMLVTPGAQIPENLPTEFAVADLGPETGYLIFPRSRPELLEAAKSGQLGDVLGYGTNEKPAGATDVVTATDANGQVIQDVVTDGSPEIEAAAEQVAGPGGSVVQRPAEEAIAQRMQEYEAEKANLPPPRRIQAKALLDRLRRGELSMDQYAAEIAKVYASAAPQGEAAAGPAELSAAPGVAPQDTGVTQGFTPTHELSDGTQVMAAGEPGLWVDADGNEIEDNYAEPIEAGGLQNPPQEVANPAAPEPDEKDRRGEQARWDAANERAEKIGNGAARAAQEAFERGDIEVDEFERRLNEAERAPSTAVTPEEKAELTSDRRQHDIPVEHDRREGDRRQDAGRRKRVDEMTDEEKNVALLTNRKTGLPNDRAYEESTKKNFQGFIDVDGLKWINDNLNHNAGDAMLKHVGQALREEFGDDAYHVSGDEFVVQGAMKPQMEAKLRRVLNALAEVTIEADNDRGETYTIKGLGFSYGIDKELDAADQASQRHKQERTKAGLRAGRGEQPPGISRKDPGPDRGDQGDSAEEEALTADEFDAILNEELAAAGIEPEVAAEEADGGQEIDAAAHEAATSPNNDLPEPTPGQKEAENYKVGSLRLHGLDISVENPRDSYRFKVDQEKLREIVSYLDGTPNRPGYQATHHISGILKSALTDLEHNSTVPQAFRKLEQAVSEAQGKLPSTHELLLDVMEGAWHNKMPHHYGRILRTEGADGDHVDVFVGPDADNADLKVFVIDQNDPQTGKFDEHKVMLGFDGWPKARQGYLASYAKGWKGLGGYKAMTLAEFKEWLDGDTTKAIDAKGDAETKKSTITPSVKTDIRRGEVGMKLAAGEVVLTATGRETSPFPKIDTGSSRKTGNTLKRVDAWLMQNAVDEARARGDNFNLRQFEAAKDKPQQADKDSAEYYLFDPDFQRPVPAPFTRPLNPQQAGDETPDVKTDSQPVVYKIGDHVTSTDPTFKGKTYRVDLVKGSNDAQTLVLADPATKERVFGNLSFNASNFTKAEKPAKEPAAETAAETADIANEAAVQRITKRMLSAAVSALAGEHAVSEAARVAKSAKDFRQDGAESVRAWVGTKGQQALVTDDPVSVQVYAGMLVDEGAALNPALFTDEFFADLYKKARTALKKNAPPKDKTDAKGDDKIPLEEAAAEALAQKLAELNLPTDRAAEFTYGWNHVIGGGTQSNMADRAKEQVRKGYQAALDWMKAEKRTLKGEKQGSTGVVLKRVQDMRKRMDDLVGGVDGEIEEIFRVTGRQELLPADLVPEGATPGLMRYLDYVRNKILPFKEWAGRKLGGGRRKWQTSPEGAIRGAFESNPDKIIEYAKQYAETLQQVAEIINASASGAEAAAKLQDRVFVPDEDGAIKWYGRLTKFGDNFEGILRRAAGNLSHVYLEGRGFFKTENDPYEPGEDRKKPLSRPRLDMVTRDGFEDHRKNGNITPQKLKETFGFADVTIGESVTAREEQDHLNYAYDALMDLATTLGIQPQDISFRGWMHFSIGALGHGRFAAHFQRAHPLQDGTGTVPVINLTKTRGDGTVAHEWFHALDFFLRTTKTPSGGRTVAGEQPSDLVAKAMDMLAYKVPTVDEILVDADRFLKSGWRYPHIDKEYARKHGRGKRAPKIEHARYHLMYGNGKKRPSTDFKKAAEKMDKGSKDGYWAKSIELFARAAEAFVLDTMPGVDTYLVNDWVAEGEVSPPQYRGTPYPTGDERSAFNGMLGALLESLEWTAEGPVIKPDFDLGGGNMKANLEKALSLLESRAAEIEAEKEQDALDKGDGWVGGTPLARAIFRGLVRGDAPKDNNELKRLVTEVDGEAPNALRMKEAQEDYEAALSQRARHIATLGRAMRLEHGERLGDETTFKALLSLYEQQPNLNLQTTSSSNNQAYSTPAPIAFLAGRMAGIVPNARVWEPTAGNAMLVMDGSLHTTYVNEIDERRYNALRAMGLYQPFKLDATTNIPASVIGNMDAVIMNPPFGGAKEPFEIDGYPLTKIDHVIAAKQLAAMRADGRAVLILGANKKAGDIQQSDRVFFNWLYESYTVDEHFEVSGDLYSRQGAGWPIRIIVISGRAKSDRVSPVSGTIQRVESYDELFNRYLAYQYGVVVPGAAVRPGQTAGAGGAAGGRGDAAGHNGIPGPAGDSLPGSDRPGREEAGAGSDRGSPDERGERADDGRPGFVGGADRGDGSDAGADRGRDGRADGAGGTAGSGDAGRTDAGRGPGEAAGDPGADLISADEFDAILEEELAAAGVTTPTAKKDDRKAENIPGYGWMVPMTSASEQADAVLVDGYGWMVPVAALEKKAPPPPKTPPKTPKENIKTAATETVAAFGDAFAGLDALFGGKGKLGSGLSFDEETYAKAKPLFKQAVEHALAAGKALKEAVRGMIQMAIKQWGAAVKPYLQRFSQEIQSGNVKFERPKKEEASRTDLQAPYRGKSQSPGVKILTPVNQADAVEAALNHIVETYGDIDEFLMKELGYHSREALYDAYMGHQVDGVALAIHQVKTGGALIVGDQTGVGKGRQAAAVIRWAKRNGFTPIFITAKPTLYSDMWGDMEGIGSNDIEPFITNKNEAVVDVHGDQLFTNPADAKKHAATLRKITETGELPDGKGVLFTTYDQLQPMGDQRVNPRQEVIKSLAPRAVFILDESHKGAGSSGVGIFVRSMLEISRRALYLSATYAKRPDNMPLYFLTDMSKAAETMDELISAINAGGVPLMEIVSNQLATGGQFVRRELSWEGISLPTWYEDRPEVNERNARISDKVTESLRAIVDADRMFHAIALPQIIQQIQSTGGNAASAGNKADKSVTHVNFTAVTHNAISQLLLAIKAERTAEMAIEAHRAGEKPVIALDSALGSFLKEHSNFTGTKVGDELHGFDYRVVLSRLLRRTRRISIKDKKGKKGVPREIELNELPAIVRRAYEDAAELIEAMDADIPASPIDLIRHRVEQAGLSVKEVTGRGLRVEYGWKDAKGNEKPILRKMPLKEREGRVNTVAEFNNGKLDVIIMNVAGSTGISMHAAPKFKDQRPRRMIVAQAALDINVFMQMLGRINRNGQIELPLYRVFSTALPAEKRPNAVLSNKMKKLNANTSSNEESSTSVDATDLMNKYGDEVIARYLDENPEINKFLQVTYSLDPEQFNVDGVAKTATGRLALMPVAVQQEFYDRVESEYVAYIEYLTSVGQNELIARDLPFDAERISSMVLHEGDPTSASPFLADAHLGKYSVKKLGKPPTAHEVNRAVEESLEGKSHDEHVKAMLAPAEKKFEALLKEQAAEIDAKYRKLSDAEKNMVRKDPLTGRYEIIAGPQSKEDEAYNAAVVRFETMTDRKNQLDWLLTKKYKIGNSLRVKVGEDSYQGVITALKMRWKEGSPGNPFVPGGFNVTIMVNGGIRRIALPISRLQAGDTTAANSVDNPDIEFMFRRNEMEEHARETRYIVTGNLLAAYGEMTRKGEIIRFTMADGTVKEGMLMPKSFTPEANLKQELRLQDARATYEFFQEWGHDPDVKKFGLSTRDQSLRVKSRSGGGLELTAAGSVAKGGKWWKNTKLTDLIGTEFAGPRGVKNVDVPPEKALAVLEFIFDEAPLYALKSMQDKVKDYLKTNRPDPQGSPAAFFSRARGDVQPPHRETAAMQGQSLFKRSAATKAKYEERIDALFSGAAPNNTEGARVLDRSDIMDMMGRGAYEVLLAEKHAVSDGKNNHPQFTKDDWKKVPEWLDNPVAVFEKSDGNLTFIAPETKRGAPIIIGMKPDVVSPSDISGKTKYHLVLTAYDKGAGRMPLERMVDEGGLIYLDTKASPAFNRNSGHRLPGNFGQLRGYGRKIFTNRDLVKYRVASQDILYSRKTSNSGKSKAEIEAAVSKIAATWAGGPKIEVVQSVADLPKNLREFIEESDQAYMDLNGGERPKPPEAMFDTKRTKVWLIADALTDAGAAQRALLHESVGHFGLRRLLGRDLTPILRQVYFSQKAAVEEIARRYGLDLSVEENRLVAAEEVLAHLAEENRAPKILEKVYVALLNWLRKIGFDIQLTKADLYALLAESRKRLETGRASRGKVSGQIAMSRRRDAAGDAAAPAALFSRQKSPNDPELQSLLNKIGSGPEKSLAERIREGIDGDWRGRSADLRDRLAQASVDQFHGLKSAEQALGLTDHDRSAYIAARMSTSVDSQLMVALMKGPLRWLGNRATFVPGKKGLLDILQPVEDKMDLWEAYMVARRAERLMAEGRENWLTDADIQRGLQLGDQYPVFKTVAAEWATFNRTMLDFAQDAGLIDAAARKLWEHDDYIPFYRIMDDDKANGPKGRRGLSHQNSGVRMLRGGKAQLNDILENMIMNTAHLIEASMKNHAVRMAVNNMLDTGLMTPAPFKFEKELIPMNQLKKMLEERGVPPDIIDSLPPDMLAGIQKMWALKAPTDKNVIKAMIDGKPKFYYVHDELLLRSLTSIDQQAWGRFMEVFRAPKRWLTTLVTADPAFQAANFVRDTLQAFVLSRENITPILSGLKGARKALKKSDEYWEMLAAGGGFHSGFVNAHDPGSSARIVKAEMRHKDFKTTVLDSPRKLWDRWMEFGSAVENANRLAVYEGTMKAGKSKLAAAYEAKDFMDFSLRGDHPIFNFLAQTVPFFNARLQGIYRLGRGMAENPASFATRGMLIAFASLALWALNKDDDRYKDLEEWDKDTYWHFWLGDKHWRFPKPFEVGFIFGTIPERIFDAAYQNEDEAGKRLMERMAWNVWQVFNLGALPQTVAPIVEQVANRDFFRGAPIVGLRLEKLSPEAQFGPWTHETSIQLGRALGVSPARIDHLLQGYFGTIGDYALEASDWLVRQTWDFPVEPAKQAQDLPVVKRFYRGETERASRYSTEFYDLFRDLDKAYNTIREYAKTGDRDRARALMDEKGAELAPLKMLRRANTKLQKISKEARLVHLNRMMTPEEKRARLDALEAKRNAIYKEAVTKARAATR